MILPRCLTRRCQLAVVFLTTIFASTLSQADGIRYRELFGRNYGIEPYVGVIRHSPNNGYKWDADVTGLTTSSTYQVTGHYSGVTRYHDFTGTIGGKDLYSAQDTLYDAWMRNLATTNPNGTYADTLEFVSNDSKYAKDLWYHLFTEFNTGTYAGHPQLAWQIGNEINNPHHCNCVPFDLDAIGQWTYFNSTEQFDGYVENFFGPAVEAIEDASYAIYADYEYADIILGSVANAYSPASIAWQRDLLDAVITDSARSPRIYGDYVWEHTDYLSIHYRMTGNLALADLYTDVIDLYDDYVVTNKIKGIYATEENGGSGEGAPTVVKVFARWMYFWLSGSRTWSPEKGAVTFWGDANAKAGGKGTLGEEILWKLFGERPISLTASNFDVTSTVVADNGAITDPEYYHFTCDADTAMVFYRDNTPTGKTLDYLDITGLGAAAATTNPLIALRFSNDTPPTVLSVTRSTSGSAHRVTFASTQTLSDGADTIVLFFGQQAMPLPDSLGGIPPLVAITDANVEDRTSSYGDAGTDVIGINATTNNVGFTATSEMRNQIKFAIDRVDSDLLSTAAFLTLRVDSVTNAASIGGLTLDDISLSDYIYASPEDFAATPVTSQAGITSGSTTTGIVQINITSLLNTAYSGSVKYLKLRLRPGSTWGAGSGDRFYTIQQSDAGSNRGPYITGVGPATGFAAVASSGQIDLSWTNPTQPPFDGVLIQRATGGYPQYPEDGTTVYDGTGTSFSDTGVTAATTYYYSLFPYDENGLFASAVQVSETAVSASTEVSFYSIGSEDGYVAESSESSNVGGASNSSLNSTSSLRLGDTPSRAQGLSVVSFDTSSIPDGATILSATLTLRRGTLVGTSPFSWASNVCYVDVHSSGFNGSTALENADFQAAATATQVATMSEPVANGDPSSGSLNGSGLSAINKTGTTQFRVYFSQDDNNDSNGDYLGFYSGENTTTANKPTLTVIYE